MLGDFRRMSLEVREKVKQNRHFKVFEDSFSLESVEAEALDSY